MDQVQMQSHIFSFSGSLRWSLLATGYDHTLALFPVGAQDHVDELRRRVAKRRPPEAAAHGLAHRRGRGALHHEVAPRRPARLAAWNRHVGPGLC